MRYHMKFITVLTLSTAMVSLLSRILTLKETL